MPQFDVFIFISSLFYLLIGFFSLMIYNQLFFLPKIAGILKLRSNVLFVSETQNKNQVVVKITKSLI